MNIVNVFIIFVFMDYGQQLIRYAESWNTVMVNEEVISRSGRKYKNVFHKRTTRGRIEYKPDEESFWYWLNSYSPAEDGLEFVKHDKSVHVGYEIWKFKKYPVDYYFRYRAWTGLFMPLNIVNSEHLQMAAMINNKVNKSFQCKGTMKEFSSEDRLKQFDIFCNKRK